MDSWIYGFILFEEMGNISDNSGTIYFAYDFPTFGDLLKYGAFIG